MFRKADSKATKQWILTPIIEGKNYAYGGYCWIKPRNKEIPSNVAPVPCPPWDEMMAKTRYRL